MLTNPNTLGLFDEHIVAIAETVHAVGGLLYYDGANTNAVLGLSRPGDMGFDIVHFNLHKSFTQPHGGGELDRQVGVAQGLGQFHARPLDVYGRERFQGIALDDLGHLGVLAIARLWIMHLLQQRHPGVEGRLLHIDRRGTAPASKRRRQCRQQARRHPQVAFH